MALPEPELRDAARAAYERGRVRHALAVGWPAGVLAGATAPFAVDAAWHVLAGALLVGSTLWLAWRGGAAGRAVGPALAAAVLPSFLPLLTMRTLCSAGHCGTGCLLACLVGGAFAGAWFGARAGRVSARGEFLAAGAWIAGLAGSLGCAFVGAAGVAGMVAAFAVVAAPVVLARRVPV